MEQVLRDELRGKHEEHEKDLKEDLARRAQSSRANLQRRRQLKRSESQGSASSSRGMSLSPSPAVPRPPRRELSGAEVGEGGQGAGPVGEASGGPDLTKYRRMIKVCGYYT